MANVTTYLTGDKIKAAGQYAGSQGTPDHPAQSGGALDVWTHSWEGLTSDFSRVASDPASIVTYFGDLGSAIGKGVFRSEHSQSLDGALDSAGAQLSELGNKAGKIVSADGALATVGATFDFLVGVEQLLSVPLSLLPSPAMPALRIGDMDFGKPHGHAHPPNLTPFGMIFLPSTGPVIPIPILSGAQRTLINGMPAARCGDIGLSIWCGSYVPLYEILLGSSSVWIEGARAARMAIDITSHCIFTVRPRPGDPPIGSFLGTTYTGSPNVIIGGVPTPSLVSMAIGKLFKLAFVGVGKVAGKLRAAKEVAEEAAEIADVRPPDTIPPGVLAAPDAIDNVLSQFSDAVRGLARLSPTLRRQLEGLERAMWAIIRGSDGKSYCDPRGFIRVAQNADPGRELTMIAHESGHAYNTLMPEVPPNGLTRDQYVHANVGRHMLDEGAAQFNAAKVRDELAQAGQDVPMPGGQAQQYSDIYDRYKAGQLTEEEAVNEMADLMRNEVNSVDNRPYPEYYGDEYQRRYNEYEAANPPAASSTPDPGATNPDLTDPAFATDPGTPGSRTTSEFDAADTNPGMSGTDFEGADTNPGTGTLPGW